MEEKELKYTLTQFGLAYLLGFIKDKVGVDQRFENWEAIIECQIKHPDSVFCIPSDVSKSGRIETISVSVEYFNVEEVV